MNLYLAASLFLLATLSLVPSANATSTPAAMTPGPKANTTPFMLSSTDIREGGVVPDQFISDQNGCGGRNLSPALTWREAPTGTQSFAISVFDPDARNGVGWMHWTLLNIPAKESALLAGIGTKDHPLPEGAIALPNSWGRAGYDGPCPPVGDKPHRYLFTIYAMPDSTLLYNENAVGWPTIDWLSGRALAKSTITATYGREVPQ